LNWERKKISELPTAGGVEGSLKKRAKKKFNFNFEGRIGRGAGRVHRNTARTARRGMKSDHFPKKKRRSDRKGENKVRERLNGRLVRPKVWADGGPHSRREKKQLRNPSRLRRRRKI